MAQNKAPQTRPAGQGGLKPGDVHLFDDPSEVVLASGVGGDQAARFVLRANGKQEFPAELKSTSSTSGSASALPATPAGYLTIRVNGTDVKVPFYNL